MHSYTCSLLHFCAEDRIVCKNTWSKENNFGSIWIKDGCFFATRPVIPWALFSPSLGDAAGTFCLLLGGWFGCVTSGIAAQRQWQQPINMRHFSCCFGWRRRCPTGQLGGWVAGVVGWLVGGNSRRAELKLGMPEILAMSQDIACHAWGSCSANAWWLPAVNSPRPCQFLLQWWRWRAWYTGCSSLAGHTVGDRVSREAPTGHKGEDIPVGCPSTAARSMPWMPCQGVPCCPCLLTSCGAPGSGNQQWKNNFSLFQSFLSK